MSLHSHIHIHLYPELVELFLPVEEKQKIKLSGYCSLQVPGAVVETGEPTGGKSL